MTKNPLINAGAATVYIGLVVLFISQLQHIDGPDNLLIPLSMLTLLVLSVLMMAYCFFLMPIQLYLDGQKVEAVRLFTNSIAVFAGISALLFSLLFSLPSLV